jgi:aldehyde dehydrogenase (NAD+)
MADKFEGRAHQPPMRAVTLALHEPVGVVGMVAPDDAPLLGLVSLVAPALAMGNTVVAVPSERARADRDRSLSGDRIFRRAGRRAQHRHRPQPPNSPTVLARHDDVDGLWVVADAATCAKAEAESIGNLKRVWTSGGRTLDWLSAHPPGRPSCAAPIEVKNVWVPYGD